MTRSPYAEQIYLLARAAEAEALRESQKRLPALVNADSYERSPTAPIPEGK